jgi:thiamine biosynthesis lipoprotein
MASDCEILMEGVTAVLAESLLRQAAIETWRIERAFSRYVDDNLIARINRAGGKTVVVDEETSGLLDFAAQCYQLSEGLFDITSGVLRRIWRFDGGSRIPSESELSATLSLVGWHRVRWQKPELTLQPDMEIDLGGIGKEYAVDKVIQMLRANCPPGGASSFLVNFGGDLACTGPRLNGETWRVGVESSEHDARAVAQVRLREGAVATSGDSRRFVLVRGERLGHILNPRTGWPVRGAPHAISVAAPTCLQAGIYSTLAILQGEGAEAFLDAQGVGYWVQR